jgi:hypothetical protein
MTLRRRAFLAVAGGVVGGVSGCTGPRGQSTADGNSSSPTASTATPSREARGIWRWLVPPSTLGRDHYQFYSQSPAALDMQWSRLLGTTTPEPTPNRTPLVDEGGVDAIHVLGADPFSVESLLSAEGQTVLIIEGDINESVIEEPESAEVTTYGEYRLVDASKSAVAVRNDATLSVSGTPAAATVVRRLVDAGSGNGERYQDANPDCARLQRTLGMGDVVVGRTLAGGGIFPNLAARGARWDLEDGGAEFTGSLVFACEDAVEHAPPGGWTRAAGAVADAATSSARTTGRGVTITASFDREVERFQPDWQWSDASAPEQSNRVAPTLDMMEDIDFDAGGPGTGVLTITHAGGDAVVRDELAIRGAGFAAVSGVDQTAPGPWQGSTSEELRGEPAVRSGDSVTLGVRRDYAIRVAWVPEEGEPVVLSVHAGRPTC